MPLRQPARRVLFPCPVPTKGDIIANRYQLVRQLGEGAMGTVWLAQHLTLEVPCAVKFILGEAMDDPSYRARFHLEARTVAQLKGPNIVRVLDHGLDERPAYIAMEYLEGEDLWTHLQRESRLDARTTYDVVAQVAQGLARAHAAGIVHRDLKPENIFLAREDGETVVKILDFGVAKWTVRAPFDEAEGLVGTPEYMSPEQFAGVREADYRSDLWALGVVAFQCVTGRLPFTGSSLSDLIALVTKGDVPVPSKVARGVPSAFDLFWAKATARRIEDRFRNAAELSAALGEALGVRPRATADATANITLDLTRLNGRRPLAHAPSAIRAPVLRLPPARTARRANFTARAVSVALTILAISASAGSDAISMSGAGRIAHPAAYAESAPLVRAAVERNDAEPALLAPLAPTTVVSLDTPSPATTTALRPGASAAQLPRGSHTSSTALPRPPSGPRPVAPAATTPALPAKPAAAVVPEPAPKKEEAPLDFGI
jgi:serine/threonine protein kinase